MDPYAEQNLPPPRRSHGCLWGCLLTLIALAAIVVAVFSFGAWHFYKLFGDNPHIQIVLDKLQSDTEAEAILGRHIKVLSVETYTFNESTGRNGIETFVLKVTGSAGEGDVKADLDISGDKVKITLLVLTGKDGQAHYLVGNPPPNPMMQNSI